MHEILAVFSILIGLISILPLVNNPHWVIRASDFIKPQLLGLNALCLLLGVLVYNSKLLYLCIELFSMLCMLYCIFVLWPYTNVFKRKKKHFSSDDESFSLISVNVLQYNSNYQDLIDIVKKNKPDILLTMESNLAWQNGMKPLEDEYKFSHKIPLENTYGMHFYTNLHLIEIKENYLVANDLPSIEAQLKSAKGKAFTFFGIHPPPPSPTEETTSKERDGELMAIAKKVAKIDGAVMVAGDFNNVAWAKATRLFKKVSGLENAHKGRGYVSTFHAKYSFFRCPIDQLFYCPKIYLSEFKTLNYFGSDHFPLYAKFHFINTSEQHKQEATNEELKEANEMINEGRLEANNSLKTTFT